MSINLKDEIVILDEAHNIEDACREATSFIITKAQLELAIQEIESSIKLSQPEEIIDAISYFRQVVCFFLYFYLLIRAKNRVFNVTVRIQSLVFLH